MRAQCAAEAEGILAKAERSKAILPLTVGVATTSSLFALLAPELVKAMNIANNKQLSTEFYLLCPLISVLAAAVSALSLQETQMFSSRAISTGNRRFAKSGLVGRTWLSATEQIERGSNRSTERWKSFAASVLPSPILAALVPGTLATKATVAAALAAVQCAYSVVQAEGTVARATDAVAIK